MPDGRGTVRGERIREADAREMLRFVSELAGLEDPEEFRRGVLPGLRELVPCEIAAYNEVDFAAESMVALTAPEDAIPPGGVESFIRFGRQNVLIQKYERTRDGRPYKWSDLIGRRELHRTDIYRELYGPLGIEFQMAFALPAPANLVIGLALNRGTRDFSERDRAVLNLIRGPMIQAYRTVERYSRLAERLAALERGLEQSGTGVVVLERSRGGWGAAFASADAAEALGVKAGSGARLPQEIADWLAGGQPARGPLRPVPPLVLEGRRRSAVVHLLPARRRGDPDALVVEAAGELLPAGDLRAAGLTARQADVLRLVARGASNAEIAAELTVSPRTVQKHLENVYERLGVRSRTQAVLTAWSLTRARGPAPRAAEDADAQ